MTGRAQPNQLLLNVAELSPADYEELTRSLGGLSVPYVPICTAGEVVDAVDRFNGQPRTADFSGIPDFTVEYGDMAAAAELNPEEYGGYSAAAFAWRPLVRFMGLRQNEHLSPPLPPNSRPTQAWEAYCIAYSGLARLCDNPSQKKSSFGQPQGIGKKSYGLILRMLEYKADQIERYMSGPITD